MPTDAARPSRRAAVPLLTEKAAMAPVHGNISVVPLAPPPDLKLFRPQSPFVALGLAVNHLMTKPAFANRRFGDWSRILVGQINRKHYCFAVDSKNQIQGFMGWALTSKENAEAWVEGRGALSFADSLDGDCVVFNAWAANTGKVNRFLLGEARKVIDRQGHGLFQALLQGRQRPAGATARQRLRRTTPQATRTATRALHRTNRCTGDRPIMELGSDEERNETWPISSTERTTPKPSMCWMASPTATTSFTATTAMTRSTASAATTYSIGGAGADALNGGTGSDTASYSTSTAGIIASLSYGVGAGGDAEGDTYASIENLTGSDFADALVGNDGNNTLGGRVRRRLPRRPGRYRHAVGRIGQRHAQGRRRCRLARRRPRGSIRSLTMSHPRA